MPAYAARAKPAARGHRTAVYNRGKAWGLGWGIWKPLAAAAVKAGVRFEKYTEVRQLVVDRQGSGARGQGALDPRRQCRRTALRALHPLRQLAARAAAAGDPAGRGHHRPGAPLPCRGRAHRSRAARHALHPRTARRAAERRRLHPQLRDGRATTRRFTGADCPTAPSATPAAASASGRASRGAVGSMDRVTGWCMINPPAAWPRGIVVNKHGARICHEGVYGSTLGDAVAHSPGRRRLSRHR